MYKDSSKSNICSLISSFVCNEIDMCFPKNKKKMFAKRSQIKYFATV